MATRFDNDPRVQVSLIHTDPKRGAWWAFGSERGWVELHVTPTGLIRVSEFNSGWHPYFTVNGDDDG